MRRDLQLAELRIRHGPAFAVGLRVLQIAIGDEVAPALIADGKRRVGPRSGDAVDRRIGEVVRVSLLGGFRDDIAPEARLDRRSPIAEHIVRDAEPRVDVLPAGQTVLRRETAILGQRASHLRLGGIVGAQPIES